MDSSVLKEMEKLVKQLNYYTEQYDKGTPEVSDEYWDSLYFKLEDLEHRSNVCLENSPTRKIHFVQVSELKKIKHSHPMLSLAKTKNKEEIAKFFGDKEYIAMLKVDGLTCSLTYRYGKLTSAETRGNGEIGEDITHNALVIKSIPKRIATADIETVCVDGEIVCLTNDFEVWKDQYENPRNFASGSIRLKDSAECYKRNLTFIAWDAPIGLETDTLSQKLCDLSHLGFMTVPFVVKSKNSVEQLLIDERNAVIPRDGLVFKFNNCKEYNEMGRTAHHFKGGIAYKFYDNTVETTLRGIEWSLGRTGVLTPIALFDEVNIEDTTVCRASLHNIDIMSDLWDGDWYEGLKLQVCKRNQIIPYIENVSAGQKIKDISLITSCPICGEPIQKKDSGELVCGNDNCKGKLTQQLDYFCGKKGLDIKGLSVATLEKIIGQGWVTCLEDIFTLKKRAKEWVKLDGFGEKSVAKILDNIEAARICTLNTFLSAIGIPMIGPAVAKEICKRVKSYEEFRNMINSKFNFAQWENFGYEKSQSLLSFDYTQADSLHKKYINIVNDEQQKSMTLQNLTFVITGSLHTFKNRQELKEFIENQGGKVVNAVSKKTSYLIMNDKDSATEKATTARRLNVPIITEEEFRLMVNME